MAMNATADPDAYWSPLRIGAISGALCLHTALLLALTLPVVVPNKAGEDFFVLYQSEQCVGMGLCIPPMFRDLPYYRYDKNGVKIKTVTAVPLLEDGRAGVLPDIMAKAERLPVPVDTVVRYFDSRPRTVELQILIAATGAILEVKVVRSSGDADVDRKARFNAWENWRFKPAFDGGQAVESSVRVAIEFDFLGKSEQELRQEPGHWVVY
ncbi:tonB family C-terminal domain protein [Lysobacter gummosus]|nr:tonB family C-terminal domain protein [Lysobacter gummosus]